MTSIGHPPLDETGDGKADNADKVDGKHDGEIDAATYKTNDIDTDGDGRVDAADDADTVDGQHAADLGKSSSEVQSDATVWSEGFAPGFGG